MHDAIEGHESLIATEPTPGFRRVPRTGVIFVMHRAEQHGYGRDGKQWVNLGQGSPEVGVLPGAPPRLEEIHVAPVERTYAPVPGLPELRDRVAQLYNDLFRRGMGSRYSAENVCIAPGGRAAMTRTVTAIGPSNLGHFIPDYTAYEELLFTFRGFIPIPILLDPAAGYRITAQELEREITGLGLGGVLFSNPSNPTGQTTSSEDLAGYLDAARRHRCALILDEFYSHFIYGDRAPDPDRTDDQVADEILTAARFVEDVDKDPVVIVDGLTKNWRLPGMRISWILGPRPVIEQVTSAGSFLDGGANRPAQQAALPLLTRDNALAETRAIQNTFYEKRRFMLDRLRGLGVRIDVEPRGAFYVWGDLSDLPGELSDGVHFFERALERRVITVPGLFFDVNPGRRRLAARFRSYSRFSFGPEIELLERGLNELEELIAEG